MPKHYDATLKQILEDCGPDWGAWLAPLLGLPPGPLIPLDPEVSTVQVAADKVFRLPGKAGLLHLEVQSSWDRGLPDRVLEYNIYLNRCYGGPVHSVAILLRRDANASTITGRVARNRHDGQTFLTFDYEVVRVWDLRADDLLNGGLGTVPLGLLTDEARMRLPELVGRLTDRASREIPEPQARARFLAGSSILMGLRYDAELIKSLFSGVQEMEESSVYQALIRRGQEVGQVEGLKVSLMDLLEEKFGPMSPELRARILLSRDTAKLQAAIRQVLTITSPAELVL